MKVKTQIVNTGSNSSFVVVLVIAAVSLLLWQTPLVYPFKLLVVLMHETGHALAALVTGGSVERIAINVREGGVTYTQGGNQFLITSFGYIGSSLIGALLIILSSNGPMKKYICEIFGTCIIIEALLWVRDPFTIIFASGLGVLCIVLGVKFRGATERIFMQSIGVMCCLYAIYDVFSDVLSVRRVLFRDSGAVKSDAQALAEMTHIPSVVWGALWIAIACAVFVLTVKAVMRKQDLRQAAGN